MPPTGPIEVTVVTTTARENDLLARIQDKNRVIEALALDKREMHLKNEALAKEVERLKAEIEALKPKKEEGKEAE